MEVYVTGENTSFTPGDVVSGLEPSELVEIQRISPFGSKNLVEGIGCQTRRVIKRPLSHEELTNLVKIRGKDCTFDGDAAKPLLGYGGGTEIGTGSLRSSAQRYRRLETDQRPPRGKANIANRGKKGNCRTDFVQFTAIM